MLTDVVLLGICVSQAGTPWSAGQAPFVSVAGGGVSRHTQASAEACPWQQGD